MNTDRYLRRRIQRLTDEAASKAADAVQWIGTGDFAAGATSAQAAAECSAQAQGLREALELLAEAE
jgi:hypothetical protein